MNRLPSTHPVIDWILVGIATVVIGSIGLLALALIISVVPVR